MMQTTMKPALLMVVIVVDLTLILNIAMNANVLKEEEQQHQEEEQQHPLVM